MAWLPDLTFRIRALLTRDRMRRELGEELAFHLEMQTRQLVDEGWTPGAAAAEARRRFGVIDREQQRARDSWGIGAVVDAMGDVRVALRQLWRRPAYTALGVGTLALGIGATVALSSVAMGLLVRPLPVADEARLQVFWSDFNWRGVEFDFVKERQRAFSGLAAYSNEGYTLRVNEQSSMVLATVGSAELFDVLGATPLMGRAFRRWRRSPGRGADHGREPRLLAAGAGRRSGRHRPPHRDRWRLGGGRGRDAAGLLLPVADLPHLASAAARPRLRPLSGQRLAGAGGPRTCRHHDRRT